MKRTSCWTNHISQVHEFSSEAVYNRGRGDIAGKILQFLGEASNNKYRTDLQNKSFLTTAAISQWPKLQDERNVKAPNEVTDENLHFLSKCLVGCFNDPFNKSPNTEVIQKWFVTVRQATAGLRVTPMGTINFSEFPSKQEAARVKAGDWFWNGRHLSLDWWSPVTGTSSVSKEVNQRWVKVFGIPSYGWTMSSFQYIGDLCGGFVGIDEDTKNRSHLFRARICVKSGDLEPPKRSRPSTWRFEI